MSGTTFAAKSFGDKALELSWTAGSVWTGGGTAQPNGDQFGMTIPDKNKGTVLWDTTLRAVGGLYVMSLTITEPVSGAYSMLDILVQVVAKPPNFCSIGCKLQSEGGTGGITCGKNSDCFSTKAQFATDPNPGVNKKCQWDSTLPQSLVCTNCEGPDSPKTDAAPQACIQNKAAQLTIEHPSCIGKSGACNIKAIANVELAFYVVGTDDYPDDNAAVGVTNLPASAVLVSATSSNPTRRLFRWTPSSTDAGNAVLFSAQSTGEALTTKSVILNVDTNAYPIYITGILRDFKASHADMQNGDTGNMRGKFGTQLDDSFAPTGVSASQKQWYKDTAGVNLGRAHTIVLRPEGTSRWKTKTCTVGGSLSDWSRKKCTNPFLPLDNTMLKNMVVF